MGTQSQNSKKKVSLCGISCVSTKIYFLSRRLLIVSFFTWCILAYWLVWNCLRKSWFFVSYSLVVVFMVAILHVFVGAGLCLNNILCLDLYWKGSMFLVWIMGGAVSFVALFFYGYGKSQYISDNGDSESPNSACQIRMPATTLHSNETRPTIYEGVFSCDFYNGMFPFSPVFCILASLITLFFSCSSCVLGQKIVLVAKRRQLQNNKNDADSGLGNSSLNNMANLSYNSSEYLLYNEDDSPQTFS